MKNAVYPVSLVLALSMAACGGSANTPNAAGPNAALPTLAAASAHVTITIPAKSGTSAAARRPAYVSPATASITVQVDAGVPTVQNLAPTSPNCSGAGATYPLDCTVNVTAAVGVHTLTFVTYDQPNAGGSRLSANSISVTFAAGQNPAIPVILAGAPAALQVNPLPGSSLIIRNVGLSQMTGFQFVWGAAQTLVISASDADGNYIVGPGSPTLAVSITGASSGSGISIAPAGNGNPNDFILQSSGFGTATLSVTATPVSALAGSQLSASEPLLATTDTTTLAGSYTSVGSADGAGSAAQFRGPEGIAYDSADGNLYVTDTSNCSIRQVTAAGVVTTIAGSTTCGFADGSGSAAMFYRPIGIAYDAADGNLYVTDSSTTGNSVIRKVSPAGVVTTIAGGATGFADGTGSAAQFNQPQGIAYDSADGSLYVTDTYNQCIRKVTTAGVVTTIAGFPTSAGFADGTGSAAYFNYPAGLAYDSADGNLYVTDQQNNAVRRVTTAGVVTLVAGHDGGSYTSTFYHPVGIAYDSVDGNLYVTDTRHNVIQQVTTAGVTATVASSLTHEHQSPAVFAGGFVDGIGAAAFFRFPTFLAFDPGTGFLYITDQGNSAIRQLQL